MKQMLVIRVRYNVLMLCVLDFFFALTSFCINNVNSCVLCDVDVESPASAKTCSSSMKGNCNDGIKSVSIRDQPCYQKGLKRWWILVHFFPLKLASAITSKHWKEEDSCCVNRGIDPASITYCGEIKTPNPPTVLGPRMCEPLFGRKATAQLWCPFSHRKKEKEKPL